MHLHTERIWFGRMLALGAVLVPLALAESLGMGMAPAQVAPATGVVNLDGHSIGPVFICFDSDDHRAHGWSGADGTFRLVSAWGDGVPPGKYRVHLASSPGGVSLPAKYQDAGTSGLDVEVAPGWNHYSFDLRRARVPGGGTRAMAPPAAGHRSHANTSWVGGRGRTHLLPAA
jgi:hypothetical protein